MRCTRRFIMTVFYRKYRPQKLSDLIGQEAIVSNLLSQLENGKVGHGYLFFGPKGTGKTSTARIFAKAVNCEVYSQNVTRKTKYETKFGEPCNKCNSCTSITDGTNLDLIEIDAASNRGIDEIRDLREKIKLSPVSSRFKVYIIDEVHMLTTEAFNALLKTLEEPPAHAIFVLCTTEANRLPATIISRLQRFNFDKGNIATLSKNLTKIAKSEGIKIDEEAIGAIAVASDGSFRDSVSILDQLSPSGRLIKVEDVKGIVKTGGFEDLFRVTELLFTKKAKEVILLIEEMVGGGVDIVLFAKNEVLFLEKILFFKMGIAVEVGNVELKKLGELASLVSVGEVSDLMRMFLVSEQDIKQSPLPQIPLVLEIAKRIGGEEEEEVSETPKDEGQKTKDIESKETGQDIEAKKTGALFRLSSLAEQGEGHSKKVHKGTVKMDDVEKNWGEFLNKVKPLNAHVFALLRSTKPSHIDDDFLIMEVFYRFHKEKLEEAKIVKMLDGVISEVIGKPMKLKFTLASREAKPTSVVKASDVVGIADEDLERIASEIFSK